MSKSFPREIIDKLDRVREAVDEWHENDDEIDEDDHLLASTLLVAAAVALEGKFDEAIEELKPISNLICEKD